MEVKNEYTPGPLDAERIGTQLANILGDIEVAQGKLRARMSGGSLEFEDVATARQLAASAVSLSKEARAWSAQHKELSGKLSLQERVDLAVAFVKKLGLHDRREFLARVHAIDLPYGAPATPEGLRP